MNVDEFVERYKHPNEAEFYESIKNNFDAEKILRLYGRAVTVFELMVLLQKKSNEWGLDTNRDRLYSALTYRLSQQQVAGQLEVRNMNAIDEDLYYLVQKVLRDNQISFYEGEFRVVLPATLQKTYTNIFRTYSQLKFLTERDCISAFEKAEAELNRQVQNASKDLTKAMMDPETISFVAAYYKDLISSNPNQARAIYTEKLEELDLPARMRTKYALEDSEEIAFRYTLYKVIKSLSEVV